MKLVLVFATGLPFINALDIEFNRITCDQSLPAYVLQDNLKVTCNGGSNTRCTFGETVQITGTMQYKNLYKHFLSEDQGWGNNWNQQAQQQQYYQQYEQQYNQQYEQQYQQQQQEEEVEYAQEEQMQDDGEEVVEQENQNPWNTWNTTGYASADLKLLSIEYTLFNHLPFNFCGDWVRAGQYNTNPCPYDGTYTFSIPYELPWDDGDITTWFATGWEGVSDLIIYKGNVEHDNADLLASCVVHWKTFVTQSDETEGWKTLPSAAQTAIIMVSVLAFLCCCCIYLSCCISRRRRRHITDADYAPDLEDTETSKAEFTLFDDEKTRSEKKKKAKDEMIHKINLSLKEPDWA
ncbi:hypothetical protein IV203_026089 [Nitzschia inconspicua]|uniref:Uncharacterized protein n=1 Tax=Nitzschia inconspicua TaxID=303405 RepID=A0A9K3PZJ3_9STRA|nr:hypothetical protein IV203_026089 [Nitzschia inconspicua]